MQQIPRFMPLHDPPPNWAPNGDSNHEMDEQFVGSYFAGNSSWDPSQLCTDPDTFNWNNQQPLLDRGPTLAPQILRNVDPPGFPNYANRSETQPTQSLSLGAISFYEPSWASALPAIGVNSYQVPHNTLLPMVQTRPFVPFIGDQHQLPNWNAQVQPPLSFHCPLVPGQGAPEAHRDSIVNEYRQYLHQVPNEIAPAASFTPESSNSTSDGNSFSDLSLYTPVNDGSCTAIQDAQPIHPPRSPSLSPSSFPETSTQESCLRIANGRPKSSAATSPDVRKVAPYPIERGAKAEERLKQNPRVEKISRDEAERKVPGISHIYEPTITQNERTRLLWTTREICVPEDSIKKSSKCKFCSRPCKGSAALYHAMRHLGINPHSCSVQGCSYASAQSSDLREHVASLHTQNLPPPNPPPAHTNWM